MSFKTIFSSTLFFTSVCCILHTACAQTKPGTQPPANVAAAHSVPHDTQASARKFVQQFYDWYAVLSRKQTAGRTTDTAIKTKATLFNGDLVRRLKEDSAAQDEVTGEIVGLDFDPFLNTNSDVADNYVAARVTPTKSATYLVDVFSVMSGKKSDKPIATPELKLQNGRWQFVNFRYGGTQIKDNENLLSILEVLRRDREKFSKQPNPGAAH